MKILFLGLGSIGLRHLRLLESRFAETEVRYFALRSGALGTPTPPGVEELPDWTAVAGVAPDVAFICNPTNAHVRSAIQCARMGAHIFVEKPLGHSMEGIEELGREVAQANLTAYVAYPLRFLPVVTALKTALRNVTGPAHVRYLASSHLADWRSGTDSKDRYSAQAALGGGVILDLSHELDMIHHLFGDTTVHAARAGRLGRATVDCEEFADGLLTCGPILVNLHMTFCSLHSERSIAIDLPDRFIRADLVTGDLLTRTRHGESIQALPADRDEMFRAQLDYFFSHLGSLRHMNDLTEAISIFRTVLDFKRKALG